MLEGAEPAVGSKPETQRQLWVTGTVKVTEHCVYTRQYHCCTDAMAMSLEKVRAIYIKRDVI